MQKSILNIYDIHKEYLVYIFANRKKDVLIGIAECKSALSDPRMEKYSKLVYFEKFKDRRSAILKKKILSGYDKNKLTSFISERNPEWLNLIQIVKGDYMFGEL